MNDEEVRRRLQEFARSTGRVASSQTRAATIARARNEARQARSAVNTGRKSS